MRLHRAVCAFEHLRAQNFREDCALIVHGGTIMAITERAAVPRGRYFDYRVKPGGGFLLNLEGTYQRLMHADHRKLKTI